MKNKISSSYELINKKREREKYYKKLYANNGLNNIELFFLIGKIFLFGTIISLIFNKGESKLLFILIQCSNFTSIRNFIIMSIN